jgi:hypothetical protein
MSVKKFTCNNKEVKEKLPLCLIKHHGMKARGRVEI